MVERRVDFRSVVRIECIAAAVAGTVAVALVWRGVGVTSLVAETFLGAGIEAFLAGGPLVTRSHTL